MACSIGRCLSTFCQELCGPLYSGSTATKLTLRLLRFTFLCARSNVVLNRFWVGYVVRRLPHANGTPHLEISFGHSPCPSPFNGRGIDIWIRCGSVGGTPGPTLSLAIGQGPLELNIGSLRPAFTTAALQAQFLQVLCLATWSCQPLHPRCSGSSTVLERYRISILIRSVFRMFYCY
jgi:hypothetical protein